MTIDQLKIVHRLVINEKWVEAAQFALDMSDKKVSVATKPQALAILRNLFQSLLDRDLYLHAATLQWGPEVFLTEPECVTRAFKAMHEGSTILFMGASSCGKCLSGDTKVIMFDGTTRFAKDIKVGDKLMGDDSTPRNVLIKSVGYGPLYRIKPERGDEWVCNDSHILSLRVGSNKRCGSGAMSKKWRRGDVVDIEIEDYLALSKDKKNRLKQFSVGVELDETAVPFDPYIYGAWIGDGGTDVPALHTPDGPMAREWVRYFESLPGFKVTVGYRDKCPMWCARTEIGGGTNNPFLTFIRTSVADKEKFIRDDYLRNSRRNRLSLLAGLIDSDGCVHQQTGYNFVSKFELLAGQVQWLARSLGFSARLRRRTHSIKSIGFSAEYWHVDISGNGITSIPTLEKHAKEPGKTRNLTNTSFSVEPEGNGEYHGFVIDGNHRFLLGDFTVTHNTYGAGAWMLLDYLRDPLYTTVKLAAINEDHLRKNLFAHVAFLFRSCAIPSKYDIQVRDSDLWMGVKEAGYEFGISGIAFKQSQETSGQFKGYKAKPVRFKPHPVFGYQSRLRVLGDEGQNWPGGPFKDFNSLIASKTGTQLIKIAVAFNPESTSQLVVQMAEPEQGWNIEEMDTLYDWTSKNDWKVCRMDAARSENVIQKKLIYPGLQTYEGFISYLKSGGDSSPNYSCFARGWPPMKGSINTIIPPSWPQEARGECTFIDNPIVLGSVDLAFMGKDSAQMAVARWGLASGYRDHMNKFHAFTDRLNISQTKPRHVLQIDQILPMEKHDDTVRMAEEIMGRARMLGIKPENLIVDKTSIGLGVHSHLNKVWGSSMGVSWNEKATTTKILSEDLEGAEMQCDGVMSEMWWTFRRWLDPNCCAILINPIIPVQPINTQLTSRRYATSKSGKIKVEAKDAYKARNGGNSPDEADSLIMLTMIVRKNSDVLPGLVEQERRNEENSSPIKFEQVKNIPIYESDDSISQDGSEKDAVLA